MEVISSWIGKLHQAVLENHFPTLRRLLKEVKGGDEDWRLEGIMEWSLQGGCPLHLAAHLGRDGMVKLLVAAGIDVNSYFVGETAGGFRYTALHYAAAANSVSTVKILLELGANPTLEGCSHYNKGTALTFAIRKGNWEVVEIFRGTRSHSV